MAVRRANRRAGGVMRRWVSGLSVACGLMAMTILAPSVAPSQERAAASFDHAVWDRILKQYVDEDGFVAYKQLGSRDRAQLDAYLARLADAKPQEMAEQERLAFWINAYNAGIVAAILRDYSPESMFSRARLLRWYTFAVAGKDRTLHEVEHEILRKQFREPRIHFALVCGATSCPKLRREAYRGEILDQQLDDQARRFINDPQRNRIDPEKGVRISSVFEWFEADFAAARGSVVDFVADYLEDPRQAEALRQERDRIEFLDYDWTLNAQAEAQESRSMSAPESFDSRDNRVCSIEKYSALPTAGEQRSCAGDSNG